MTQIGRNWFKRKMRSLSPHCWHNNKLKSTIYLYRENHKTDRFNKGKEKWKVLLMGKRQEILSEFETKELAIEFMENWMRENQE